MSANLVELREQARYLTASDRAELAYAMLESLEPAAAGAEHAMDAALADEWIAVAQSRWAEIERGEAKLIPADEVFAAARRLIR